MCGMYLKKIDSAHLKHISLLESRTSYNDYDHGTIRQSLCSGCSVGSNNGRLICSLVSKRLYQSSRRKTKQFSSYFRFPTSHTTVRAVPHTAVPILDTIRDTHPLK